MKKNTDPVFDPSESPYATNKGNPIQRNDPDGDVSQGGPTVSAGIKLTVGTRNTSVSFNFSVTQKVGDFTLSAGGGITTFSNFYGTGKKGTELRASAVGGFDNGNTSVTLGTNKFSSLGAGLSPFSQRTGILYIKVGDFHASYENDGTPFPKGHLSDGDDKYRTAAASIGIGEFTAGFNLFTGLRTKADYKFDKAEMARANAAGNPDGTLGQKMPHGYVCENGTPYRMGAAYISYGSTKIGVESDRYVRHPIQDIFAHHILSPQPGFETLSKSINPYFQVQPQYLFSPRTPVRFSMYE
jgi:hypothetical protein